MYNVHVLNIQHFAFTFDLFYQWMVVIRRESRFVRVQSVMFCCIWS